MNTPVKAKVAPLSQRSGLTKLLIGLPLLVAAFAATMIASVADAARLLAAAAGAYVVVGTVELIAGSSISRFAKSWDQLPAWKQNLISTIVIVGAIFGFLSLLPVVSRLTG